MPDHAPAQPHQSDQLIVDLRHLEIVEVMLGRLGIGHADIGPDDQDELLGLARLRDLTDGSGAALEVGEILALLRQRAAALWGGWQPEMGKNRVVDAVIGDGTAGHKPMPALSGPVTLAGHKPMALPTGLVALAGHKPMALPAGLLTLSGHKPMAGAEPMPAEAAEGGLLAAGAAGAGQGVRVCVIDTPPAPDRPGTPEHPVPFRAGHGTFVADLIGRQAPAADIHIEGVLDPDTGRADSWDTARTMVRLVTDRRPDILNLSIGCYTIDEPPLVLARALDRLGPEVLVVAAAGNHGGLGGLTAGRHPGSPCWPAAMPLAVAVGAVDGHGVAPDWSPRLPWVTCTAPGVDVVGAYLTGSVRFGDGVREFTGQARWSGTSFAAATVTGAVAARTVPGSVTPRQALADLLAEGALVRPFADAR